MPCILIRGRHGRGRHGSLIYKNRKLITELFDSKGKSNRCSLNIFHVKLATWKDSSNVSNSSKLF